MHVHPHCYCSVCFGQLVIFNCNKKEVQMLMEAASFHRRYYPAPLEEKLVWPMGWRTPGVLQWSAEAGHGGWHPHESRLHQHPQLCCMPGWISASAILWQLLTLKVKRWVFLLWVFLHFLSDLTPPEGKSRDALLQIVCRDGRVISLCADSADDAL